MSVSSGSERGPKVELTRAAESYLDLLAEFAGEDEATWRWGAALYLYAHGWSCGQIARALGYSRGYVYRQIRRLQHRMTVRFAA